MGGLSWWHWLIVIGVVVILFGAKRLPDAARGVGRSLRILKSEVHEMQSGDDEPRPTPVAIVTASDRPTSAPAATVGQTVAGVPVTARTPRARVGG